MLLWSFLPTTHTSDGADIVALQARVRALEAENAAMATTLQHLSHTVVEQDGLQGNWSASAPRRLAEEDPVTCQSSRRKNLLRFLKEGHLGGSSCECEGLPIGPGKAFTPPEWARSSLTSIYDASAPLNGEQVPLSRYRAKATLVVNVASA